MKLYSDDKEYGYSKLVKENLPIDEKIVKSCIPQAREVSLPGVYPEKTRMVCIIFLIIILKSKNVTLQPLGALVDIV